MSNKMNYKLSGTDWLLQVVLHRDYVSTMFQVASGCLIELIVRGSVQGRHWVPSECELRLDGNNLVIGVVHCVVVCTCFVFIPFVSESVKFYTLPY